MKNIHFVLLNAVIAGAVWTSASPEATAQLTTGRLVVLQAGNGSSPLVSTGNPVFLKEYLCSATAQSVPTAIVALPATGLNRLVISGSAATEGLITRSADSTFIVIPGYDTSATNTTALPASGSTGIKRVVDTVGLAGIGGRAVSTTAFSGKNIRGAVKGAGNDYWAVGGGGGVQYLGHSNAAAALGTTVTNIRALQASGGNLYFSSSTGSTPGITKITGMPTVAAAGTGGLLFSTGSGSQPGDFAVNAGETIVYVADTRTTAAGGIQKWVLSNGSWAWTDTLVVGAGARGLTVDWSGVYPVLYATTTDNRLVSLTDSNFATGYRNSYVTIATAPSGTAFRGVAFTPQPAAPCTAPTLTATATPANCTTGGSITLTITGGSPVNGYAWTGPGNFTANTQNLSNLSTGTYAVMATTAGGCTSTATATVTSTASISAAVTAAGPTAFCQGGSVVLQANAGSGYAYQWFDGPTAISGATSASFTATASGGYSVQVTDGSCTAASTAIAVVVDTPVTAAVTATGPTAFCPGDSAILRAAPTSGVTYQWYHSGGAIGGATDSIWTARTGGNYRVIVRNGSCSDTSAAVLLTVYPRPIALIAATDTTFCNGDSVLLRSNPGTGLTFRWAVGGNALPGANGNTYTARTSGNYRVIVSNSNGCADTSRAVHLTAKPLPKPVVIYTGGQLTVQNAGQYTNFRWYWNSGGTPVGHGPLFTPPVNGSYTVEADSNGCTGRSDAFAVSLGLPDVQTQPFRVYPNPTSDAFQISPAGAYRVRITDMQGRTVLETENTGQIVISSLADGLYLLYIRTADNKKEVPPVKLLKKS